MKFSAKFIGKQENRAWYQCTVTDTGIGMSEKFMRHMFEPFAQEHYNEVSVYQGTGLGMPIVKSLVDRMGGRIEVRSEVGIGTTFSVTIPFEIATEVDVKRNTVTVNDQKFSLNGVKILLVEDNELNLEIASYLLHDVGAVVSAERNGKAAVKAFESNPEHTYDVILMDVMMPVLNGLEATKKIRALNRADAKTIPIIAMTANAFAEDVKAAKEAGMNDHLAKPLDVHKMIWTIRKYI